MTWKDKLELGLKEDAPYRKDNLPDSEITGPEIPTGPGRPGANWPAKEHGLACASSTTDSCPSC